MSTPNASDLRALAAFATLAGRQLFAAAEAFEQGNLKDALAHLGHAERALLQVEGLLAFGERGVQP